MHVQEQEPERQPLLLALAFDDSPAGWAGLRFAIDLARPCGWSLTILHAALADVSTFDYGARTRRKYEDARAQASQLLARAQAQSGRGVRTTTEMLSGDPGIVVPQRAAELGANILVVGSSRRGAVERILLGSVGEAIVRRATSPVLIVPVPSESPTGEQ